MKFRCYFYGLLEEVFMLNFFFFYGGIRNFGVFSPTRRHVHAEIFFFGDIKNVGVFFSPVRREVHAEIFSFSFFFVEEQ